MAVYSIVYNIGLSMEKMLSENSLLMKCIVGGGGKPFGLFGLFGVRIVPHRFVPAGTAR